MPWCDHWLMRYEKTCMGVRLLEEYPAAVAWLGVAILLLLAVLAFLRWRAA
jgi:hypothetical protein